jgi:hypothetical protein
MSNYVPEGRGDAELAVVVKHPQHEDRMVGLCLSLRRPSMSSSEAVSQVVYRPTWSNTAAWNDLKKMAAMGFDMEKCPDL